ncbi:hypothetical protein GF377_11205 [candidate division GN15 bacterium]|nr:hypothetical protein [candidate division GN15 bacterium]
MSLLLVLARKGRDLALQDASHAVCLGNVDAPVRTKRKGLNAIETRFASRSVAVHASRLSGNNLQYRANATEYRPARSKQNVSSGLDQDIANGTKPSIVKL